MRAAVFLFAALLGCSRTTLELPNGSSSTEQPACPSGSSWVVSPPVVIARGRPGEASRLMLDIAVNREVTAIAHDVEKGTYHFPLDVHFLRGDVLGPPQSVTGAEPGSVSMIWTGERFRAVWSGLDAHVFMRDFDRSGVAAGGAVDLGWLDGSFARPTNVFVLRAWPDALLLWVGTRPAPRYLALAPDGTPVGPTVPLTPEPREQQRRDEALRRERLFVATTDLVPPEKSILRLVTFNEATRAIESTRELARALNLEVTSVLGGPDGAVLVTAVEYGRRMNLFTVRGDVIERSTLPVGEEYGAWLVENASGTAALMSYSGSTRDPQFSSALHFSPMKLSDRSIGDAVPVVVGSPGIVDTRVVADGCGFAVAWREFSRVPGESFTTSFARITPR